MQMQMMAPEESRKAAVVFLGHLAEVEAAAEAPCQKVRKVAVKAALEEN